MSGQKIFVVAHVPVSLQQSWLQHLRDFDTANPGCHFEIMIDAPDIGVAGAIERLRVNPSMTFEKMFDRKPTLHELLAESSRINQEISRMVLGDPRESVTAPVGRSDYPADHRTLTQLECMCRNCRAARGGGSDG